MEVSNLRLNPVSLRNRRASGVVAGRSGVRKNPQAKAVNEFNKCKLIVKKIKQKGGHNPPPYVLGRALRDGRASAMGGAI